MAIKIDDGTSVIECWKFKHHNLPTTQTTAITSTTSEPADPLNEFDLGNTVSIYGILSIVNNEIVILIDDINVCDDHNAETNHSLTAMFLYQTQYNKPLPSIVKTLNTAEVQQISCCVDACCRRPLTPSSVGFELHLICQKHFLFCPCVSTPLIVECLHVDTDCNFRLLLLHRLMALEASSDCQSPFITNQDSLMYYSFLIYSYSYTCLIVTFLS